MVVLLHRDKMTEGVFGAQCAWCRVAGDGLRWFRLCYRTHYPAGRSRWMRCGHKQTDMISNNTQTGAAKLSSTGTAHSITDPPHPPQVDTFMFYVVYMELWPFTCRRINHDSTDETLPPWANLNGVGFLFSAAWNATWCGFLHHPLRPPSYQLIDSLSSFCQLQSVSPFPSAFWAWHRQKSSKTQHRDSLRIPEEGNGNSAACFWVIQLLQTASYGIETVSVKSDHFVDLSLVMWLTQPMRTSPSGSVWSLLGQSGCEKQEGG